MVYHTSTDGVNWVGPTIIRPCRLGIQFSIWFDETYLHYVYADTGLPWAPILYRRGTPESDGTIDWSGVVEQTAVAAVVGTTYFHPYVSVDSNGSAYIGYAPWGVTGWFPFVTKSSTTTGIWVTDIGAGFPYQLSTVSAAYFVPVIPLSGGEMLAVYARAQTQVNAKLWNGAVWGSERSTINKIASYASVSAVAEGNDVHLVFTSYTSFRITYAKYDHSSNKFTAEKFLTEILYPIPVISIDENNNLLVFWVGYQPTHTLCYMIYTAETDTWGPAVKWKSEDRLMGASLACFYRQYSGYTGIAYTTGAYPGPYAVKFNYIASQETSDPTPEPEVVSNTLTASGSRHTTPEQGSVGTYLRIKRGRLVRHITWVRVVVVRA